MTVPVYLQHIYAKCHFSSHLFQCLVKSGSSDEGNPDVLPNSDEVNGMIKEPLPVTVGDGDVREGGDSVIGRELEKEPLAGDDMRGSIPTKNKGRIKLKFMEKWNSLSVALATASGTFKTKVCKMTHREYELWSIRASKASYIKEGLLVFW